MRADTAQRAERHVDHTQHRGCVSAHAIALGRVFFGESMFTREADASKVCLAALVSALQQRGVPLIDCQQETQHLAFMGARPIRRREFASHLIELIHSNEAPEGWIPGPVRRLSE